MLKIFKKLLKSNFMFTIPNYRFSKKQSMILPIGIFGTILFMCSFISPLNIVIFGEIVKKVAYNQKEFISYSVSDDVNFDQIHSFDLASLRPGLEVSYVEKQIFADGKMRVERLFNKEASTIETDFVRPAKSISEDNGTTLFDESGQAIHFSPVDPQHPFPKFDTSESNLAEFGYHEPVLALNAIDIPKIMESGFQVSQNESGDYSIFDASIKISFSPSNQSILTEEFNEGKKTRSIYEVFSQVLNSTKYVKILTVERTYSPLQNGGVLQTTNRIEYSEYQIDDISIEQSQMSSVRSNSNDVTIQGKFPTSDLVNSNSVTIFPNPANQEINIKINQPEEINSTYNILSLDGKIWLTGEVNSFIKLNISELTKGIYLVQVKNNKNTYYNSFIKN